jgi:RND family efflux transporter MFP subunit
MNMETPVVPHEAPPAPPPVRHRNLKRGGLILLPVIVLAGVGAKFAAAPPAPPVPPMATVGVAAPLVREITEWDDYVGRFAPSRTVEVRPRVAGEVTSVRFRDGEVVRAGQLLFTIDPRPFAAALAEAQAGSASARSTLALARTQLARATRLIADEGVSQSEVDELRARVQAAQASLAAADARVRARTLDLGFTQVRAPISGRISDRRVDAGNQVSGGEGSAGTLLTTVNALDPIYFGFDASEGLYLKMLRGRRAGGPAPEVQIRLQDETAYRWTGRLDFTDNGLDSRSGTIRGRAVITNTGNFLTPGMFGNMRLSTGGRTTAMLVPDEAVQTDQARKVLYVVDGGGTVLAKPVELGPLVDGLRVIRSGLAATDRVVINGAQVAAPGSKVHARATQIAASLIDAPPPTAAPLAGEATFAR